MTGDSKASSLMRKERCVLRGCKCLGVTAIYAEFGRLEIEVVRKRFGRMREAVKMDGNSS